jgi:lysine 6-dehydrogenase
MRALVLGAGIQGEAAIYDLARQADVTEVIVADTDGVRAEDVVRRRTNGKGRAVVADASRPEQIAPLMRASDTCVSAVPYFLNEPLARTAIAESCHFCDLGGNNDVVDAILALDAEAQAAGVSLVPDTGLAPGMANVVAAHAIRDMPRVDWLRIRVGGLPQHPVPPLGYKRVFSIHGLINEYVEPARLLRDGEEVTAECLTDVESVEFPPLGMLEAFVTSGGASTLPRTLKGRVRDLDYKTLRYPGHAAIWRGMALMGLLDSTPVQVGGATVRPRDVVAVCASPRLENDDLDLVAVRVEAIGTTAGGERRRVTAEMLDYHDASTGLSAMARTTAFPSALVAAMLGRGQVTRRGALPQELALDVPTFIAGLAERTLTLRWSDAAA